MVSRGTFIISWTQTELNGLEAAPVHSLSVGAAWSWRGDAVQVDETPEIFHLDRACDAEVLRRRAANLVHHVVGAALRPKSSKIRLGENRDFARADSWFMVTDGARRYTVTLINIGRGAQPLLMFLDALPPRNTDLWIVSHTLGARLVESGHPNAGGVICFTPGTRISTPRGPVLVEHLRVGDLVQTKDNGAQPIEWIGQRHMTDERLFATPSLRPVRVRTGAFGIRRPDQELLVSPEHRLVVTGPIAREMFDTPEVLVSAKDLIDGQLVVTDENVKSVTYIHLLLPGHNILWANGVETESFHPANTALDNIAESDRSGLLKLYPELAHDPFTYGGHIRRNLSTPEAAILRGVA